MSERFVVLPRGPVPPRGGSAAADDAPMAVPGAAPTRWTPTITEPRLVARPRHPSLHALDRYFDDPDVTDIFVNGPDALFVDRGRGAVPDPAWAADEDETRDLAVALIGLGGRHIDDAKP